MPISKKTQQRIGKSFPDNGDLANALGVSRATPVLVKDTDVFTSRELTLLRKAESFQSNALSVEDSDVFSTEMLAQGGYPSIISPTYNFSELAALCQTNNSLLQAVAAMVVNIDGTGFEFERVDGADKSDADEAVIADIRRFFDEPYPDVSFITMRRELRADIESTGNGYLEVIRDSKGQAAFLRRMDAKLTRMVRLDNPVTVTKTITRMGKELKVDMVVRERRFAQAVGTKIVFFKQFGASRDLNRDNGHWGDTTRGGKIDESNKATEVMHFTAIPDITTPYGVPRWINQVPSVLGSREAEVYNLEFFKHGGMPPALIFIQGGSMEAETRKVLTNYLASKPKEKMRGMVIEVAPVGGTLSDTQSGVRVSVERFGSERQNDAMFMNYDVACAEHVRGSFRLPELFVGKTQGLNMATAYTAYMVAEAQVFKPERDEFDEIINVQLMRELAPEYRFRSLPVTLKDVTTQLSAIGLVAPLADPTKLLDTVNEIAGLDLTPNENPAPAPALPVPGTVPTNGVAPDPAQQQPPNVTAGPPKLTAVKTEIVKTSDEFMVMLAEDWAAHLSGTQVFTDEQVRTMANVVKTLSPNVRKMFNGYIGMRLAPQASLDSKDIADAIAAAGEAVVSKRARAAKGK